MYSITKSVMEPSIISPRMLVFDQTPTAVPTAKPQSQCTYNPIPVSENGQNRCREMHVREANNKEAKKKEELDMRMRIEESWIKINDKVQLYERPGR